MNGPAHILIVRVPLPNFCIKELIIYLTVIGRLPPNDSLFDALNADQVSARAV
jgi:hypothetical protein